MLPNFFIKINRKQKIIVKLLYYFFTKNISPLKEMLQLVTISDYMDMYSKRQNNKMTNY